MDISNICFTCAPHMLCCVQHTWRHTVIASDHVWTYQQRWPHVWSYMDMNIHISFVDYQFDWRNFKKRYVAPVYFATRLINRTIGPELCSRIWPSVVIYEHITRLKSTSSSCVMIESISPVQPTSKYIVVIIPTFLRYAWYTCAMLSV